MNRVLRWLSPEGVSFYIREVHDDGQPVFTVDPYRAQSFRTSKAAHKTKCRIQAFQPATLDTLKVVRRR